MLPLWLKLLRAHDKNRGYGLALPFLLGATRIPVGSVVVDNEQNQNIADIKRLLVSMRDETPVTSYISLTICDRLRQPVFRENSIYFKPSDLYARIPKMDSKDCLLYVASSILGQGNSNIEKLSDALWKLNGDAILRGAFSFSNGGFTKYSDEEFSLILSVSQAYDDDET